VSPAVPQRHRCHLGEHVPYRDLGPDHFDRLAKNHPSLRPSAGATRPPGHDRTRAVEGAAFWDKPGWHVLEARFELVLANAAHIRNVAGREENGVRSQSPFRRGVSADGTSMTLKEARKRGRNPLSVGASAPTRPSPA